MIRKRIDNLAGRVNSNPELKKILANINWLFFDKVIQMAVAFVVGIWVVRYLGPEQYGALNYSIAFVALFSFISRLGIDEIAVREFVKHPEKKGRIFGTALYLRFAASVLAVVLSLISIFFVKHGNNLAFWLTFFIALSFIFQVADVVDLWFQSEVKSRYSVYIRSSVSIIIGLLKIVLVLNHAPLIAFAVVILFESFLAFIGFTFVFIRQKDKDFKIRNDLLIAKEILRDSWPLMLASVATTIYMKIDQIMIGSMLGNEPLGIYSVAVTLSEIWYFLPVIITASVFPAIIYSKSRSRELYDKRLQILYDGMLWLSIFIAILVSIFAQKIIITLFGPAFGGSAVILSVYVWAGIFVFVGSVNNKYWISENLTKISLYLTVAGAVANIILNLWLIPIFGILGSALATLISYGLATTFLAVLIPKARIAVLRQLRSLNIFRIFKNLLSFK